MILFITRKYPPSVGGMQRLSYRLTTEISKLTATRVIGWGGSQRWLPLFVPWALVRALAVLAGGQVTLIHLSDPVLSPLGVLLRWLTRVPVVVNAHGLDVTYPFLPYQAIVPWCLRRLDRVICISQYTREECIRRGVATERCDVIPLGIDVEDYQISLSQEERRTWLAAWGLSPSDDRHILLTVGRLVRRKGLVPFVSQVLPLLRKRRQDWVYLIIGEGPEHERLQDTVRTQGLSEQVRILGFMGDQDVQAAYALADLFVMPNVPTPGDPEGFGMVTLEARAAGTPVVAADLEGIRDAMSVPAEKDQGVVGKTPRTVTATADGTLVGAEDWPAFAGAIESWLDRTQILRSAQDDSRCHSERSEESQDESRSHSERGEESQDESRCHSERSEESQDDKVERAKRRQRIQARYAWPRIAAQYLAVFDQVRAEHSSMQGGTLAHRH
jgi:phosphatidylinositol alpha-1,6-mannosyltransferase